MSSEQTKYPRTPHLRTSPGATSDDKWLKDDALAHLSSGVELVVTEKMDGGNLTMTRNHFFARSLDSGSNVWDFPAKALWASLRYEIPEGWRVTGESMYARRSVSYDELPGPFIVFGIWNDEGDLLSWDDMNEWAELLGLPVAPLLYRGTDFDAATKAWASSLDVEKSEGFVLRDAGKIPGKRFASFVAKWVRANHVRTDANWRSRDDFDTNTFV